MNLNADFTQRAAVHAASTPWVPSPMPGVERKMLDRMGDEVARATTIVRYSPGSRFSAHVHDGGEEYLVLEGVFQDEHGDFPTGTYVRNPPGSRHAPRSDKGATILVKLWQFDPSDRMQVVIPSTERQPTASACEGVEEIALYKDAHERVRIELWPPGARVRLDGPGGMELFVVAAGLLRQAKNSARTTGCACLPGMSQRPSPDRMARDFGSSPAIWPVRRKRPEHDPAPACSDRRLRPRSWGAASAKAGCGRLRNLGPVALSERG